VNVYVETNFALELTFQQEELKSCEQILQRCESKGIQIVIPAYSLAYDIINELNQFNCRMIWKFEQGYNFIESQLL